jgi:DNA-binding NarL/FixJ family response regulator
MNESSKRMHPIRLVLLDEHTLWREGLSQQIANQPDMVVCESTAECECAVRVVESTPIDVAVIDADVNVAGFFPTVEAMRIRRRGIRVVMLLWPIRDRLILRARSANIDGIVCSMDSTTTFIEAIRAAHAGRRLYTRMVCERLARFNLDRTSSAKMSFDGPNITAREFEVMQYVVAGKTVKETAQELGLSPQTVDNHKARLMKKVGVHSGIELTRFALREGYASL